MNILHSKILGSGTPLLILHGYFGMGDNWKTLGATFAENFEVHLIDQRNHGRSFHEYTFNYEVMVSDLYRYMEYHQLQKVYLLGHSMGGKTAMLFATTYPKLVEKLVIADISPKQYQPHHDTILEGLNAIDFSVQTSRKAIDERLSKFIPELGVRQFLLKNVYWKEKGQLDFRFYLKSLTENNSEVGKALPSDAIFDKETLFLKGDKSNYIVSEDTTIQTHFPKATIQEITNTGHWLHAENPKDFYEFVFNFLLK